MTDALFGVLDIPTSINLAQLIERFEEVASIESVELDIDKDTDIKRSNWRDKVRRKIIHNSPIEADKVR